MNEFALVGIMDRAGQRLDQASRLVGRLRLVVEQLLQAAARDVFQGEERTAGMFADLVDLDNVGVPEPGDGLGFAAQARLVLGLGRSTVTEQFQRHVAMQRRLPGPIHHAERAAAESFADLIAVNVWEVVVFQVFRVHIGQFTQEVVVGQRVVDLEQAAQVVGQLWKAAEVIVQRRGFVVLIAQVHFLTDQVEQCLAVGGQFRFAREVLLDDWPLAPSPAFALLGPEGGGIGGPVIHRRSPLRVCGGRASRRD